jgi:signal transduction histidine kinase
MADQIDGNDAGVLILEEVAPKAPRVRRGRRPRPVGHDVEAEAESAGTQRRTGVLHSTRVRMLVAYLVLLVVAAVLTMIAIREVMVLRLSEQTEEALRQEVLEARQLVESGLDPATGEPFESLERAFDIYLDRNVPSVQEAFVTVIEGEVFRDRLRSFPGRQIPSEALASFAAFAASRDEADEIDGGFDTPDGQARYRAVRFTIGGQSGAFVVAILPAAERREIGNLQTYGGAITFAVVLLAALCAWFLAGRVLAPVRKLTETARTISDAGATRRISVTGSGEAAEMAATFNSMLDRLEAAYRSQLDFLRAAGHELRTPLTVATGHLEVPPDEGEREATTALILDELSRMGRIIDDLQCLAEAVRPDFLQPGELDLTQLAHDLVGKASALGDRSWQLDETASGTMFADRHRITEAVLNLADNAVKSTQAGDTIGIGVARRGSEVHIWVRDTGVGLDPEEFDRVFERFVRGNDAARRYRGAGLGLAIVKTIAEAHGGSVRVDSELGVGAQFTIVLPGQVTT